ncbi:WD40/YVTN repeat-like-containing domain protein [Moelleriella libera RCEF 2490]|uniref:WD40/YVTN repeat-like-containing domain protein n=1 Tax=Moelleriella libera RCEF 2490 TaxID=1081109 RepID=A0A168ACF8_9HYPO|nr:WD40/YVTN repeat-like-containing domain protein [Moelleriella libera RCEF 2490]
MFHWYQNATRCYVYLSDVAKPVLAGVNEPPRSTWKFELRASRWFTRGWTLQELLAPSSVEFFTLDEQRLGDKKSLEQLLHDITGIAIDALRGSPLSTFGVDERISWSKGRETTCPEDKAYSLLGIFNVRMRLDYGEGEEPAFERLRKKLNQQTSRVLDKLPVAEGAAFYSHAEEHSSTCLEGTRVELLREIQNWAGDTQAKPVFWLRGMAGTGKSTISRTIATLFYDNCQLGASFFFKRGEGDRGGASKFYTTLAAQLVMTAPGLAPHIQRAIDDDPAICGKAMREQFDKLILRPLSQSQATGKADNLVIVIDALDECEQDSDIETIVQLCTRTQALQSPRLRVFITSRPEHPIRLSFDKIRGTYQDLVLHKLPAPVIERDISIYFHHELAKIREEYNRDGGEQLPLSWPESSDIRNLVQMAIPLFIFAATVCRFLADTRSGHPIEKLRVVLEHQTKNPEFKMDATYLRVLKQLLAGLTYQATNKALHDFRIIVGSIIVLASPLSRQALAQILNIAQNTVDSRLKLLHAVLDVPQSCSLPIKVLHHSFRDFLLDPEKRGKNQFWVDEKETHMQLVIQCLRVMNKALRRDICGVRWPGTPLSSIDSKIISDKLQPEVQYACQYWVYHLQHAGAPIHDTSLICAIYDFLKQHFLHWLEALSLIGKTSESLEAMKGLQSFLQPSSNQRLLSFLNDAIQFIPATIFMIEWIPLQVYCSALTFAPKQSIIRDIYQDNMPTWMSLVPEVAIGWDERLPTRQNCDRVVSSVAFSPDSKLVASVNSYNKTIRIWAADTGKLQHTLEGQGHSFGLVAFSPDSKLLMTVDSKENKIRICAADTGKLQQTLEDPSNWASSVAFSPDSKLVASGSYDMTVRIWAAETGKLQQTLEGHGSWVSSVAFSPDTKLVATGSADMTVRIWAAETGKLQQTLEGHDGVIDSVAFSPDSQLVASGLGYGTVQIWVANIGKLQQTLEGHGELVFSVAISPDSKLVASSSIDRTFNHQNLPKPLILLTIALA